MNTPLGTYSASSEMATPASSAAPSRLAGVPIPRVLTRPPAGHPELQALFDATLPDSCNDLDARRHQGVTIHNDRRIEVPPCADWKCANPHFCPLLRRFSSPCAHSPPPAASIAAVDHCACRADGHVPSRTGRHLERFGKQGVLPDKTGDRCVQDDRHGIDTAAAETAAAIAFAIWTTSGAAPIVYSKSCRCRFYGPSQSWR